MRYAFAAATALAFAAPAQAVTVFSDNFDSENGGGNFFNYASFANFSVTGAVDIIAHGSFGIACVGGSGSCVDLAGSASLPGKLTSLTNFAFNAGDFVRFSFDISGNQRVGGSDDFSAAFTFLAPTDVIDYGINYFGSDTIALPGLNSGQSGISTSSSVPTDDPYSTRSIFFTAASAGSLTFSIETFGNDNAGPIVDNLRLDITPANGGGVPEPTTWAMMLLGFAAVGASMRRKQHTARVRFAI